MAIYDDMRKLELRPMNEIDSDPVRQQLDERFAADVLHMDASFTGPDKPLEILRSKLAREPSVAGHKGGSTSPEGL